MKLPPCGLYRTRAPLASIPAGRLVYFHNHGDPGPGVYLPESWKGNQAQWQARGTLLPDPQDIAALEPLSPEGLYRVIEPFDCCEKRCRRFESESLVQLGYNAAGEAILFVPEWVDGMLAIPTRGNLIVHEHLASLKRLRVAASQRPDDPH
jgi:hypothetical protein